MICIGYVCDKCKNMIGKRKESPGKVFCNAFPDGEGIPKDVYKRKPSEEKQICNNGIGYDPDPELVELFKRAGV